MTIQVATTDELERIVAPLMAEIRSLHKRLDDVQMAPKKEWLTVQEYADQIGKSAQTVKRYITNGKLETKRSGTAVMIRNL